MKTKLLAQPDALYEAMLARDARFDGHFFVGVKTTGIYCRPICRVRTPRRENCVFYAHAAAAESAGFRPCLRCRPELAPGSSSVDAHSRIAMWTARALATSHENDATLADISVRVGTTDRNLRRAFVSHFGVSPIAYAQTQRLLQAKRLLHDTRLPVTEVAFAAGFRSVRRFNALMKKRYGMTPSALRGEPARGAEVQGSFTLTLAYRLPFDWNGTLAFLAGRTVAGVEAVADGCYVRAVRMGNQGAESVGHIVVQNDALHTVLRVTLTHSLARFVPQIVARVARQFDLGCAPLDVSRVLGPLALGREGLRLPGAFDPFEAAVRAIAGQQVSVKAAATIAGRIAAAFGIPMPQPVPLFAVSRTFPPPAVLAAACPGAIAGLGMPLARAHTIVGLAQEVAEGRIDLDDPFDVAETTERLLALPGIGPWTVQYLTMRALSWPDAFPADDLGVKKAFERLLPSQVPMRTKDREEHAERWRPWRSYATLHLWASLADNPVTLKKSKHKMSSAKENP